jgi:hypothetical protein
MNPAPVDLVLISWDGQEPPLQRLQRDADPDFRLLLFDYSGQGRLPQNLPAPSLWLSQATACKGEILAVLAPHLRSQAQQYRFIGLIDDDISISVAQINAALQLAANLGSISFSPALHPDDGGFLPHMVARGEQPWRRVAWVELKMSFVRSDLFLAAAPFYPLAYSGYGIDCFIHPYLAQVLNLPGEIHVFDQIVVRDCRPHRSGQLTFPNGLTGLEEAQRLHRICLRHLALNRPDLLGDPTIRALLHLAD